MTPCRVRQLLNTAGAEVTVCQGTPYSPRFLMVSVLSHGEDPGGASASTSRQSCKVLSGINLQITCGYFEPMLKTMPARIRVLLWLLICRFPSEPVPDVLTSRPEKRVMK